MTADPAPTDTTTDAGPTPPDLGELIKRFGVAYAAITAEGWAEFDRAMALYQAARHARGWNRITEARRCAHRVHELPSVSGISAIT